MSTNNNNVNNKNNNNNDPGCLNGDHINEKVANGIAEKDNIDYGYGYTLGNFVVDSCICLSVCLCAFPFFSICLCVSALTASLCLLVYVFICRISCLCVRLSVDLSVFVLF